MTKNRTDRPNVLVFFTDQQRYDAAGVHGNPLDLMPNFDRLAMEGTHLYNCFTCQPVCGPARATLQTGLYAKNTGVFRNGIPLSEEHATLADFFNAAGYHTGYIGKWHLSSVRTEPVPRSEQGRYDYWLASNVLEFTSDAYHTVMYDKDSESHFLPGYRVDALADATIDYITDHQDEPFYLFTSYIEPHFQNHADFYPAPEGYAEKYRGRWVPPDLAALGGSTHQHIAGYWGMIKRLDEAFGRILDALTSLGLRENTIVLFTTDHGCHFKTRNNEYKRSCHESSIRLPTVISGPGFEGGGRIKEMVSLVDLPPTLLDAAGLEVPEVMDGRSVLPLVNREPVDWPEEAFVQISEAQVGRAIRTKRWKYSVYAPEASGGSDPDSDTYVEEFLYDLESDPYELRNLIHMESHAPIADQLRERLIARMVEAGEEAPEIIPAERHPSGQRRIDLFEDGNLI